jgi:uncharacterized protein with HEPN domain
LPFRETAVRVGKEADTIAPGPDWKGFRGMGDILRHGYHRIEDSIIWNTIKDGLPGMREAIMKALRTSDTTESQN